MANTPVNFPPSSPGYRFNAADLARAGFADELIAKAVVEANQQAMAAGSLGAESVPGLLASILQKAAKQNSFYRPTPFIYGIWTAQQVLTEDARRNVLMIQNVGAGDLLILFEGFNTNPTDMSSADGQQELTVKQSRAIRLKPGGAFTPMVPPLNAVTLFTLAVATNGLVISGRG